MTYADLSRLAADAAAGLSSLGVEPGETVCLLTRNRVASLALLFACRRLGATLAPISHLLTPVTVERPFDALEPAIVVAEAAQRDLVRSIPCDRSVTLEELAERDADADDWREADAGADGPLLALHGENGWPIVAYGERALERNCLTAVVAWGLSRTDVVPLTSPLARPAGLVRVALPTLYVGGRLLLDRAFDPGDALTAIADHGATFLAGSPTALRDLAAETGAEAVESLERAIVDGPLEDDVRSRYLERGVPVVRVHGRLECPTAFSRSLPDDAVDDDPATDERSVGRPVPDCRVGLVDDGTALEGPGEGRLRLSGPVLADGYVTAAGIDDGSEAEADAEVHAEPEARTNDQPDDPDEVGRFVDGWFETGRRFRRDEDGRYRPVDR